jgi:hypothetical protein
LTIQWFNANRAERKDIFDDVRTSRREAKRTLPAVHLSILPILTVRLLENLPRLAARRINLPVHTIKLAIQLTRLPVSLA